MEGGDAQLQRRRVTVQGGISPMGRKFCGDGYAGSRFEADRMTGKEKG